MMIPRIAMWTKQQQSSPNHPSDGQQHLVENNHGRDAAGTVEKTKQQPAESSSSHDDGGMTTTVNDSTTSTTTMVAKGTTDASYDDTNGRSSGSSTSSNSSNSSDAGSTDDEHHSSSPPEKQHQQQQQPQEDQDVLHQFHHPELGRLCNFPNKLFDMLNFATRNHLDEYIGWTEPKGKSFEIRVPPPEFMKVVGCKFFPKQSSFRALERQLNNWGFQRLTTPTTPTTTTTNLSRTSAIGIVNKKNKANTRTRGRPVSSCLQFYHPHFQRDQPHLKRLIQRCSDSSFSSSLPHTSKQASQTKMKKKMKKMEIDRRTESTADSSPNANHQSSLSTLSMPPHPSHWASSPLPPSPTGWRTGFVGDTSAATAAAASATSSSTSSFPTTTTRRLLHPGMFLLPPRMMPSSTSMETSGGTRTIGSSTTTSRSHHDASYVQQNVEHGDYSSITSFPAHRSIYTGVLFTRATDMDGSSSSLRNNNDEDDDDEPETLRQNKRVIALRRQAIAKRAATAAADAADAKRRRMHPRYGEDVLQEMVKDNGAGVVVVTPKTFLDEAKDARPLVSTATAASSTNITPDDHISSSDIGILEQQEWEEKDHNKSNHHDQCHYGPFGGMGHGRRLAAQGFAMAVTTARTRSRQHFWPDDHIAAVESEDDDDESNCNLLDETDHHLHGRDHHHHYHHAWLARIWTENNYGGYRVGSLLQVGRTQRPL